MLLYNNLFMCMRAAPYNRADNVHKTMKIKTTCKLLKQLNGKLGQ